WSAPSALRSVCRRSTPTLSLMNEALELHDSIVGCFSTRPDDYSIVLERAYIHQSVGRAGIDSGQVFVRDGDIVFSNAEVDGDGPCGGTISGGKIVCGTVHFENVLPLPLDVAGPVEARIDFVDGGQMRI